MLSKIVNDIKELRIQGATNIALAGVQALKEAINSGKKLEPVKKALLKTRPNEPMMHNLIDYVIKATEKQDKKNALALIETLKEKINNAKESMIESGKTLIKPGSTVFTHCHASSVISILKAAKNNIKMVYCTESRPRYQGRLTAQELIKAGLNVTMVVDSAVANYIKKADYFMIGCDVITSTTIINKIGSRMISILADKYDVPLYICSLSYKYSPESVNGQIQDVEERDIHEVWPKPPKGLKILNPAFDTIDFENVTGFITEYGILPPNSFINLMQSRKEKLFD